MSQEHFQLSKNSFFVSWIFFSTIFFCGIFFLVGVILIASSLTQNFFYLTLVFSIFFITICNLIVYLSYQRAKNDIIDDFVHPRDDTETLSSRFLQFFYSQHPVIFRPFEFVYRILQLSISYGPFYSALEIRRDWYAIWENQGNFCDEKETHSAIMIGVYNPLAKTGMLGCGVSILIQWFNENNEKYRVWLCRIPALSEVKA